MLAVNSIVAVKVLFLLLSYCFLLINAKLCNAAHKPWYILNSVQTYINSISTMKASFEEIDLQKGIVRKGTLYISRPGKIKWEYESPDKRIVIASNNKVIYYDYTLEELSVFPSKSNILKLLSKAPIDLHSDCRIISMYKDRKEKYINLVLTDNTQEESGDVLILKFIVEPKISLSHVSLVGSNGEVYAEILLTDLQYNIKLRNDIFLFKDPRFFKFDR